jgi:hypothetical protein
LGKELAAARRAGVLLGLLVGGAELLVFVVEVAAGGIIASVCLCSNRGAVSHESDIPRFVGLE